MTLAVFFEVTSGKFCVLQIKAESPFPPGICHLCYKDFLILKGFLIRLNEGQAIISEKLSKHENILVKSINFLAEKKSLFREKYPCMPKIAYSQNSNKVKLHQPSENLVERSTKRQRKLPSRYVQIASKNKHYCAIFIHTLKLTNTSIISFKKDNLHIQKIGLDFLVPEQLAITTTYI